MGCGIKLARFILFAFNALVFIFGIAALAVGIWVLVDEGTFFSKLSAILPAEALNYLSIRNIAWVLIACGIFTFVVGFCGCCGAVKESKCLLYLYAFLIIIIVLAEITGAIILGVFRSKVTDSLKETLMKQLKRYNSSFPFVNADKSPAVDLFFDFVMMRFNCCGINGKQDFSETAWNNSTRFYWDGERNYSGVEVQIPVACCQFTDVGFYDKGKYSDYLSYIKNSKCPATLGDSRTQGCEQSIKDFIARYAGIIIGVAAGIGTIEILGILCACCLISAIKRN